MKQESEAQEAGSQAVHNGQAARSASLGAGSPAGASVVELQLDSSQRRGRLSSGFRLKNRSHCRSLAASKWTDSRLEAGGGCKSEAPRRTCKSTQEILSATQFTDAELNRIILSVGGGYLLKEGPSPQSRRPHRSQFDIHNNKISYLGFDRLIRSTKQHRESQKVSSLIA